MEKDVNELLHNLYKKDIISFGHSTRVGELVGEFWMRRGADQDLVNEYRTGGFLHDIGKLSIPDSVLKKEGRLTDEEFDIIQGHAKNGLSYLNEQLRASDIIRNSVEHHHEAFKGTRGYPDKSLHGENIPEESRVLAVFDVYDALSSRRQYKEPIPQDKVFDMMKNDEKLDPAIVEEAISFIKEREKGKNAIINDIEPKKDIFSINFNDAMKSAKERTEQQKNTRIEQKPIFVSAR